MVSNRSKVLYKLKGEGLSIQCPISGESIGSTEVKTLPLTQFFRERIKGGSFVEVNYNQLGKKEKINLLRDAITVILKDNPKAKITSAMLITFMSSKIAQKTIDNYVEEVKDFLASRNQFPTESEETALEDLEDDLDDDQEDEDDDDSEDDDEDSETNEDDQENDDDDSNDDDQDDSEDSNSDDSEEENEDIPGDK